MKKILAILLVLIASGCSSPEKKYFGNDILGLSIIGYDDMTIKTDNGVILNIFNDKIGILLTKSSVQFSADSVFNSVADSINYTKAEMQRNINEKILSFATTSTYEMNNLTFNNFSNSYFSGFYYSGARNKDGINMLLGIATPFNQPYKMVYFNVSYLAEATDAVFTEILPSLSIK